MGWVAEPAYDLALVSSTIISTDASDVSGSRGAIRGCQIAAGTDHRKGTTKTQSNPPQHHLQGGGRTPWCPPSACASVTF